MSVGALWETLPGKADCHTESVPVSQGTVPRFSHLCLCYWDVEWSFTAKACRSLSSCSVWVSPGQHLIDSPLLFPYESHLTLPSPAMLQLSGIIVCLLVWLTERPVCLSVFLCAKVALLMWPSPALPYLAVSVSSHREPRFGQLLTWEADHHQLTEKPGPNVKVSALLPLPLASQGPCLPLGLHSVGSPPPLELLPGTQRE